MDFPPNPSISSPHFNTLSNFDGTTQQSPDNGSLSQLLSHQNIEGDETSEWLSVYVEDCLSGPVNYGLASASYQKPPKTLKQPQLQNLSPIKKNPENLHSPTTRERKKRTKSSMKSKTHKRPSIFGLDYCNLSTEFELDLDPDPPLLQQAYWLADSELIYPMNQNLPSIEVSCKEEKELDLDNNVVSLSSPKTDNEKKKVSKHRRCSHCQADKTPLWRQGPLGKGTLCNACGVRWLKTGNLFPEYRPANSPTFVSNLHSNVLRKVLKMREARQSLSADEE